MKKIFATTLATLSLAAGAQAGTFLTAVIDDSFAEWAAVPVLDSDGGDNAGSVDIGDIKIANDDDFLYITITYPNSLSVSTFTALDVDSDTATGFDVFSLGLIGSEASWQNDFPFTQAAGVFNNGQGMSGDFFGSGAANISAGADPTQKEWAISLDITFNETGLPVFADDDFDILFWTDAGAGDVSSTISYTLATVPEPSGAILLLCAAGMLSFKRRR